MENQEATIHNNHEPDAANAKRKRSNNSSSSSNCSSTSTSDEGNGANLSVEELMKQLGQMCGVGRNRHAGGPTTEANGGKKLLVPDKHLREQFKAKMADMEECANRKAEISDLEGRVRVLTSKNEPRHAVRIVQMQGLANKLKAKNDKVKRGLHTILYQRPNGAGGGGSTSTNSIFGNGKKARPPPTANRQSAAVAASSVGGGGVDQFFGHPLAKREKQSSAAVAAVDFIGRHCSAKVVDQWRRMNE